ncbi:hypothetical protein C2W62_41020 [Candidatus Entotheonella serta]|nr:hypothetical protein C2W62_41020 [Candidatus Entotheonella serta]
MAYYVLAWSQLSTCVYSGVPAQITQNCAFALPVANLASNDKTNELCVHQLRIRPEKTHRS